MSECRWGRKLCLEEHASNTLVYGIEARVCYHHPDSVLIDVVGTHHTDGTPCGGAECPDQRAKKLGAEPGLLPEWEVALNNVSNCLLILRDGRDPVDGSRIERKLAYEWALAALDEGWDKAAVEIARLRAWADGKKGVEDYLALQQECERLRGELESYRAWERSVNETLNSGDGSYKP